MKIGVKTKPKEIILNNEKIEDFKYDEREEFIVLSLPAGNNMIFFTY